MELIQGIILSIIAILGIFCGSKLLLKIIIFIFPLFILTYAVNLFSMGFAIIKTDRNHGISFFIQASIYTLLAIYILLNPIETLGFILVITGIIIIANALSKMLYFPNYMPIGSLVCGIILIVFSETLIDIFYTVVMIFLLFYGVSKISHSIYNIKNND